VADQPTATDWIARIRARQWLHFLVLPLAGYEGAAPIQQTVVAFGRGILIAFGVLSFGYLLNAVADRRMDRDAGKNPLTADAQIASCIPVLLMLAVAPLSLAMTAPRTVLFATVLCLLSGVVYSVGPRLKCVPIVGTAINTANFAPLLWVGVGVTAPSNLPGITALFCALLLQNQLLHEGADATEDRFGNVRTTFLTLGPSGAAVAAAVVGAGIVASTWWLVGPVIAVSTVLPIFGVLVPCLVWTRGASPTRMASARRWHRWASAVVGALAFFGAPLA